MEGDPISRANDWLRPQLRIAISEWARLLDEIEAWLASHPYLATLATAIVASYATAAFQRRSSERREATGPTPIRYVITSPRRRSASEGAARPEVPHMRKV